MHNLPKPPIVPRKSLAFPVGYPPYNAGASLPLTTLKIELFAGFPLSFGPLPPYHIIAETKVPPI
jgi:hypothetical protein